MTRDEAAYRTLRLAVRAMSRIPLPVGGVLGGMVGAVMALAPVPRLRVALDNMRACLGHELDEAALRRLYGRMCRHFGRMLFEVPHVLNLGRVEDPGRIVTFEGERHILEALERGRGAFVLTGHFGNWEIMSAAFMQRFHAGAIVVRPVDFRPADRLLNDLRGLYGGEIIPKQKGMRRVLGALSEGKPVGILLDQNVDWYEGAFVPFLGRTACTNKGLALLALRTGAPVVPMFAVRRNDGGYRVVFEPPVPLQDTGDKLRDVDDNTARFTAVISRYVRAHPDHWFWFHRRWKTKNFCPLPGSAEGGTP